MSTKKDVSTVTAEVAELQATEVKILAPKKRRELKAAIAAAIAENPKVFRAAIDAVENAAAAKQAQLDNLQDELNIALGIMQDIATSGDTAAILNASQSLSNINATLQDTKDKPVSEFAAEAMERLVSLSAFSEHLGSARRKAGTAKMDRTAVYAVKAFGKVAIVQPEPGDNPTNFTLWELDDGQWIDHGTRKFEGTITENHTKLAPVFTGDEIEKIRRNGKNYTSFKSAAAADALKEFANTHPVDLTTE